MAQETFLTPLINRDLISPQNTPIGAALSSAALTAPANPYRYTNLLGGVTMTQPLSYDVYGAVKRSQQKNLKNFAQVAAGIGGGIATLFVGSKFRKLFKSIGKMFKKAPATATP